MYAKKTIRRILREKKINEKSRIIEMICTVANGEELLIGIVDNLKKPVCFSFLPRFTMLYTN